MPNKSLKCETYMKINVISCPGVWLQCRNELFIKIFMFGQQKHTRLISAVFPLFIFEKFYFEKHFPECSDPAELASALQDEIIFLELVQLSNIRRRGMVLATYEGSAREFLFPLPIIRPVYTGSERELLFNASPHFSGIISPKLEFSTSTTIKEFKLSSEVKKKQLKYDLETAKKSQFSHKYNETYLPNSASSKHTESVKSDKSCTICELYKKYFKKQYVGHHHPPFSLDVDSYNISKSSPALDYDLHRKERVRHNTTGSDYSNPLEMKQHMHRRSHEVMSNKEFHSDFSSLESKSLTDINDVSLPYNSYRQSIRRNYTRNKFNDRLEKLYTDLYNQIKWRERSFS